AVAAWLGAGSKEVIVAAPVLALLYDRALVAGSFAAAWRARRAAYAGLFSSWLLVAALVAGAGNRGGTVGFGSGVAWGDYALTQCDAIARYVGLSVWPRPLIFDYGVQWFGSIREVAPQALLVAALVGATVWGLVRGNVWGFLGGWFFAMLAPTSLIPGNRQTIAEHRMYLSLAVPMLLAVLATHRAVGGRWRWSAGIFLAVALAWGGLTWRRNRDYHSVRALYADTAAKRPGNAFAHYNLAKVLAETGAPAEAVPEYAAAIRLRPGDAAAHFNLGNAFVELGRAEEAVAAFAAAVRVAPGYAKAHYNLGNTLVGLGRREAAAVEFAAAARLAPGFLAARENLGSVLTELGRLDEARREIEGVLRAAPELATARFALGNVFFLEGDFRAAAVEYERALRADGTFEPARAQLAKARAAAR
ncbi:MAG: repeat-containing protein YrrB, partial [Verrucomicrobiota bacterium]